MRYKQVVFLGMHRTNSSFIASWFQACGLDVGDRLVEPSAYNKKGYFEDKDFVELHKEIFNVYEIDITGLFKSRALKSVDHLFIHNKAGKLVSNRDQCKTIWGFKDPRTCLVYKALYRPLLSSPFLIVTYRPPREVVNSILNREFKITDKTRLGWLLKPVKALYHLFIYPRIILKAWVNYNEEILSIISQTDRDGYIVLSRHTVLEDHKRIIHDLNKKGITLHPADPSQLFDKSYLSRKPHPYFLDPFLLKKALKIEKRLKTLLFKPVLVRRHT